MKDKPYYNHDQIWEQRHAQGVSVWGRFSDRVYQKIYTYMEPFIPSQGRVLDVGCGAGRFGEFLEERGYDYTGVDESKVAIQLGNKARPQIALKVVDFAQPLPESFPVYDILTAINSLHCLVEEEHRDVFWQNVGRATVPGGVIVLSTMCGPLPKDFKASKAPRIYLSPDELTQEAKKAGIGQLSHREDIPANYFNPIPNVQLIFKNG